MLIILLLSLIVVSAADNGAHSIAQRDISEMSDRELIKELMMEIQILKNDRDIDRERFQNLEDDRDIDRERIQNLVNDRDIDRERIQNLENDRDIDRERIQNLENDRDIDRERIRNLEKTVDAQNDLIASLQQTVATQAQEKTHDMTKTNLTDVQPKPRGSMSESTYKKRNAKRLSSGQAVAFSSYLKSGHLTHLGANQNIVFDSTFVNIDNVYNVHHGVFTVPVSGLYVITATVLSDQNREVYCQIVLNGNIKAHVYARGTDGRHDQGSQTILLHLNQGDDVSIQNQASDDAVYGDRYTTFSGFLLFEDETPIVG